MRLHGLLWIGVAVSAAECSVSSAGSSTGFGAGGAGGGYEGTSTVAGSTVVGSTSTGLPGASSSGSFSSGTTGAGGGEPVVCADVAECGNFGSGCVNCAIESSCAEPYQKCFADAECKAYAMCIEPCTPKGVDCVQACEKDHPLGAVEYGTLTQCIFCGDCALQCEHPNDVCK